MKLITNLIYSAAKSDNWRSQDMFLHYITTFEVFVFDTVFVVGSRYVHFLQKKSVF